VASGGSRSWWVFQFWVSREKEKAPQREREGVVERERETELGVTVREKEGLGLREGGETVNGCHRRDFEDLGHGGPDLPPTGLSPYRPTLSLSRSGLKLGLFF
jgi:hypothetical protein